MQIGQGFHHIELGLYFRELFLNRLTSLWILCVLAMFVQTVVNNKYLGHFVMVLYIIATIFAAAGRIPGLSLSFRTRTTGRLLRYQWLWAIPAAADLAADLLGRRGNPAGDHHESALGARYREQLARASESCGSALQSRARWLEHWGAWC